jgi:hypothetical protein
MAISRVAVRRARGLRQSFHPMSNAPVLTNRNRQPSLSSKANQFKFKNLKGSRNFVIAGNFDSFNFKQIYFFNILT